jgi:hypothetical protein
VQCAGKAPGIRFLPHTWHPFGYRSQVVYRDKGISQRGERKKNFLLLWREYKWFFKKKKKKGKKTFIKRNVSPKDPIGWLLKKKSASLSQK